YEPPLRAQPLNAWIASGVVAAPAVLLALAAGVRVWVYHIVLANMTANPETCVITGPEAVPNTYTVEVPANTTANPTAIITSTPDAPLFVARVPAAAAGNITFYSDVLGAVTATITYVTK
ncbi:unnamed protein product, partial [marine sediment metagenome]